MTRPFSTKDPHKISAQNSLGISPAIRAARPMARTTPRLNAAALAKGLAAAMLLLVLGSLALAAAYCFSALSTPTAHLLQFAVLAVSALVGGLLAAKSASVKGMHHGILLALAIILLMLIFSLSTGGVTPIPLLLRSLVLLLFGALGGIIGVL